jgi:hypothetical protein
VTAEQKNEGVVPELPSGSRNEPTVGATAALTKGLTPGVWYYRGWTISPDDFGGGWTGTNADYDVSWEGEEDGWVDNGEKVVGTSLKECCDEIDAWIAEAEENGGAS